MSLDHLCSWRSTLILYPLRLHEHLSYPTLMIKHKCCKAPSTKVCGFQRLWSKSVVKLLLDVVIVISIKPHVGNYLQGGQIN